MLYYYLNDIPTELNYIQLNKEFVRIFANNLNLEEFVNLCNILPSNDIIEIYFKDFCIDLKYRAVKRISVYENQEQK